MRKKSVSFLTNFPFNVDLSFRTRGSLGFSRYLSKNKLRSYFQSLLLENFLGLKSSKFKGAQLNNLGYPGIRFANTSSFYRKAFRQKFSKPLNYLAYEVYDYWGINNTRPGLILKRIWYYFSSNFSLFYFENYMHFFFFFETFLQSTLLFLRLLNNLLINEFLAVKTYLFNLAMLFLLLIKILVENIWELILISMLYYYFKYFSLPSPQFFLLYYNAHLTGQVRIDNTLTNFKFLNVYILSFFNLIVDVFEYKGIAIDSLDKFIEKTKEDYNRDVNYIFPGGKKLPLNIRLFFFMQKVKKHPFLNNFKSKLYRSDAVSLDYEIENLNNFVYDKSNNEDQIYRIYLIKYIAAYIAEIENSLEELPLSEYKISFLRRLIILHRMKTELLNPTFIMSDFGRKYDLARTLTVFRRTRITWMKKMYITLVKQKRKLRFNFKWGLLSKQFKKKYYKKKYIRNFDNFMNFLRKDKYFFKDFLSELNINDYPRKTRMPYGVWRHFSPNKYKIRTDGYTGFRKILSSFYYRKSNVNAKRAAIRSKLMRDSKIYRLVLKSNDKFKSRKP